MKISQEKKDAIYAAENAKVDQILDLLSTDRTDPSLNYWNSLRPQLVNSMVSYEMDRIKQGQILTNQIAAELDEKYDVKNNVLITAAFPPTDEDNYEIHHERLFKLRKKLDKLKYITKYGFTFEFYSPQWNPHCHILLYDLGKKINKQRLIRDFSTLFKLEENFIDIKYKCEAQLPLVENYITGQKDDSKMANVITDNCYKNKIEMINYFFSE